MAVPFSNTKLRVPRGFQNLLEGLAKEVLRNQPDNIYAFAAVYFGNLLKIREEQGIDPAEIGTKHEDRFYNNKAFSKAGNIGDVSDPQQQEAATTIQAAVRGHQAREGEAQEQENAVEEEAATKIQAAYRGYEARKRVNLLKEGEQNDENRTEGKVEEEVDIDLNDPEVEKAATMIQKSYRGFHTRKTMKSDKDNPQESAEPPGEAPSEDKPAAEPAEEKPAAEPAEEKTVEEEEDTTAKEDLTPENKVEEEKTTSEEVDIDLTDPEVEKAALKIQGGFRGMKVRKEMKEKNEEDEAGKEEATDAEEKIEEKEVTEKTDAAEEEEVDIDLNDPEVGKAALKIQAGFRGYKDRKNLKKDEEGDLQKISSQTSQYGAEVSSHESATAAGNEELFSHIDASDPKVNLAASKIQAGFKGMMVRNQLKETREEEEADVKGDDEDAGKEEKGTKEEDTKEPDDPKPEEEEIDIDLTDPEVEQAAIKIQAGFKTMMNKKKKTDEGDTTKDDPSDSAAVAVEEKTEEGDATKDDPSDVAVDEEKVASEEGPVTGAEEEPSTAVPDEGEGVTDEGEPVTAEEVAVSEEAAKVEDTTPAAADGDATGADSTDVVEEDPNTIANEETAAAGDEAPVEAETTAAEDEGNGKENEGTTEGEAVESNDA